MTALASPAPLPLAPWVGGKRNLSRRLVARIAATPHRFYGEPFVGMGGVFLRRPKPAPVEAINDRGLDVANLFRVVRRHPEALAAELRLQLVSRAEFRRLLRTPPDTLTDIERAARFLLIQRLGYGGQPDSTSFPARPTEPRSLDADHLRMMIEAVHRRLARVTIECLDWAEFLSRYDRPDALFYLDPPYWGCEDYYGKGLFDRSEFARLAEALAHLKGRFILSLNDRPEIRSQFARFSIEEEPLTYHVAGRPKRVTELVISKR
ncbi:MAG: DNA adenine methylase [Azospirillum sp.]|nr:DNA adenine methylase [Azospirillum sp.]